MHSSYIDIRKSALLISLCPAFGRAGRFGLCDPNNTEFGQIKSKRAVTGV
jgi:hypothetical protein